MKISNKRKQELSWLKKNDSKSYEISLKLQKFLFLYESMTKVAGEKSDFSKLEGWKNGPVFNDVWYNYRHEREKFDEEVCKSNYVDIDVDRAKKCSFIVKTLTEEELSDFTHEMNIWKSQEKRIINGEQHVKLDESDFNDDDVRLINELDKIYPMEMVENSEVVNKGEKYFVFSKTDYKRLTEEHHVILDKLKEEKEIYNPVFVEIDDEGRLLID